MDAYLGGLLQTVTRLADAAVDDELGDADFPHGVGELLLVLRKDERERRRASDRGPPVSPIGSMRHAPSGSSSSAARRALNATHHHLDQTVLR